jgi:hypothetical protein
MLTDKRLKALKPRRVMHMPRKRTQQPRNRRLSPTPSKADDSGFARAPGGGIASAYLAWVRRNRAWPLPDGATRSAWKSDDNPLPQAVQ